MGDVFISYKRDERHSVELIASKLNGLGLQVWFDAQINAGDSFGDEIDREVRASSAVLVCWSKGARQSQWVKSEAQIGFDESKLVAASLDGHPSAPTPFNTVHTEDLRSWLTDPTDTHSGWKSILRSLGRLCGRADIESWAKFAAQPTTAELEAWKTDFPASPLTSLVQSQLREIELLEAEREKRAAADAVQRDPAAAAAFADRGTRSMEYEDFDAALEDFDEAIRRDPAIELTLATERAEAFTGRGCHHLESDRIDDAIDDFEEAIRLQPALAGELNTEIAGALMRVGRDSLNHMQFDDAIEAFEQAIQRDPSVAEEARLQTVKAVTKALTP